MSLILDETIVAVKKETTEGVYVAPASATDGYIVPMRGKVEIQPMRELLKRDILAKSLSAAQPIKGMRNGSAKFGVELRGGSAEGAAPDFGPMLESLFGSTRSRATRITTRSGVNTTTTLLIEDADIADLTVGSIFVILKAGAHHLCAVTARVTTGGSASVTFTPAAPYTPASGVALSKFTMYEPVNHGHPSLSASVYWGDGALEYAYGLRTAEMSLQNFKTGQLPSLEFTLDGMGYGMTAASSAPQTPTYSSTIPGVALDAKVYQAGTEVLIDNLDLSIAQPLAWLTATGNSSGRFAGRAGGKREVKGGFSPYLDTDIANYGLFDASTQFSVFARLYAPSATAGEFQLGSVVGIWMPRCIFVSKKVTDQNGVLVDKLEIQATGDVNGDKPEIYMGFI